MKINLRINNLNWEIYFKDFPNDIDPANPESEDEQDLGMTKRSCNVILINKKLKEDLMIRTIDHEITHAYFWSFGLTQIKSFTEENFADFIETHGRNIIVDSNYVFNKYKEKL